METAMAVFRGGEIRKTLHNDEWWIVVEDVVLALIDSKDSKQYVQRMKQRGPELGKGWGQAEPFKRWLAKVGYERAQEIEEPELTTQKSQEVYWSTGNMPA
jgi:DNA-damage-inducible protein D